MRSANPALNNNTFRNTRRFSGTEAMTIDGTVNKTALGLLLLMTTAIYLGNFLNKTIKQNILKVIPVFVVIIGLLFIIRGLGLGIPYLSPTKSVTIEQINSEINCH